MLKKINDHRKLKNQLSQLSREELEQTIYKLCRDNQHHMDLLAKYMIKYQKLNKLIDDFGYDAS